MGWEGAVVVSTPCHATPRSLLAMNGTRDKFTGCLSNGVHKGHVFINKNDNDKFKLTNWFKWLVGFVRQAICCCDTTVRVVICACRFRSGKRLNAGKRFSAVRSRTLDNINTNNVKCSINEAKCYADRVSVESVELYI